MTKRVQRRRAKLKVGSVVRLKSGGPQMTIDAVKKGRAVCVWFEKEKRQAIQLALTALEDASTPKSMTVKFVSPTGKRMRDLERL